jgi:hypothetical protein
MKYEAPELTALTSAINAVQTSAPKPNPSTPDGPGSHDAGTGYEDWE